MPKAIYAFYVLALIIAATLLGGMIVGCMESRQPVVEKKMPDVVIEGQLAFIEFIPMAQVCYLHVNITFKDGSKAAFHVKDVDAHKLNQLKLNKHYKFVCTSGQFFKSVTLVQVEKEI